jgi:hypothetical protein
MSNKKSNFPSELVLPEGISFSNSSSSPIRKVYEQSLKQEQEKNHKKQDLVEEIDLQTEEEDLTEISAVRPQREELVFDDDDEDDDENEYYENDHQAQNSGMSFFGKPSAALAHLLEEVEQDNEITKGKHTNNNNNATDINNDDEDEESEVRRRRNLDFTENESKMTSDSNQKPESLFFRYDSPHSRLVPNAVFISHGNEKNIETSEDVPDKRENQNSKSRQIPQLSQFMMISEDQEDSHSQNQNNNYSFNRSGTMSMNDSTSKQNSLFKGLNDRKSGMMNFLKDLIESSDKAGNFVQNVNQNKENKDKISLVNRRVKENKFVSEKSKAEARMECVKSLSLFFGL